MKTDRLNNQNIHTTSKGVTVSLEDCHDSYECHSARTVTGTDSIEMAPTPPTRPGIVNRRKFKLDGICVYKREIERGFGGRKMGPSELSCKQTHQYHNCSSVLWEVGRKWGGFLTSTDLFFWLTDQRTEVDRQDLFEQETAAKK